ncbi:glycosyltransferase family 2 protein [Algibacter sp.]|uniref:glycosyltransferase family 2 protein n=1 Tax=Algibacter sp. TaxID=1872428 RepID=UPI003C7088AC
MNKLVSIIVPCYNQAHFLEEALQSVLDQTYSSWECIIVNDGSPDNTEEIAQKWCKTDKRFKYIFKENGGLPSARNSGIKISEGEYILPLDSDDILHEDYLIKLVPVLNNNQSLAIASCYRKFFKKDKDDVFYEYKAVGTTYHSLMFENILMPSSLFRKQCWTEVGGYDETMTKGFEDWEFWISILKRGWEFRFVEEFLFYYRKSNNSMLTDTLQNHSLSIMEYVFNKHKEIYVEHHDNTIKYLFFLLNSFRNADLKTKNTNAYKLTKLVSKPFSLFSKILKKSSH